MVPKVLLSAATTNISKLSLKELLSDVRTKADFTRYLREKLLISFSKKVTNVVSYDTRTNETCLDLVDENLKQHSHEEADTQIPLHVFDIIRNNAKSVDVWPPDTDVLILLMDLLASRGQFTSQLHLLTGKGEKSRKIDIVQGVLTVGKEKGLIGLHNFSGADWGGKFAGISKKTWIKSYLALDENDTIIKSFQKLGEVPIDNLLRCDIPTEFLPLETSTCLV